MDSDTERFLTKIAEVCRCALPVTHNKVEGEKTLDDRGIEFLGSGYLFLYEGHQPNEQQFQQLKEVAAATAITYKQLRDREDELDDEEKGLLQLCRGFLYLWSIKVKPK